MGGSAAMLAGAALAANPAHYGAAGSAAGALLAAVGLLLAMRWFRAAG